MRAEGQKTLLDYTCRFKVARSVLESRAKDLMHLPKLIAAYLDYDTSNNDEFKELNKELMLI